MKYGYMGILVLQSVTFKFCAMFLKLASIERFHSVGKTKAVLLVEGKCKVRAGFSLPASCVSPDLD